MAPSFNGQFIFGYGVSMALAINPRRDQRNAYPALNGVESLDLGDEGAFTTVTGRLVGATPGELAAALGTFYSFYDGNAYVLVDQFGGIWPFVKLESFQPEGRIEPDPNIGYTRRYTARFFHLTLG